MAGLHRECIEFVDGCIPIRDKKRYVAISMLL